jgi:TolB-like protein
VVAFGWIARGQTRLGDAITGGRILVAPFDNRTGDASLDAVGAMASDWIAQGLAQTEHVDVAAPSQLLSAANDANPTHIASGRRPAELARASGAAFVVTGAYYRQANRLQFQVQVTDWAGTIVAALDPVESPVSDPVGALETLRERTAEGMPHGLDTHQLMLRMRASPLPYPRRSRR